MMPAHIANADFYKLVRKCIPLDGGKFSKNEIRQNFLCPERSEILRAAIMLVQDKEGINSRLSSNITN